MTVVEKRQSLSTACGSCGHMDRHLILFQHNHSVHDADDITYYTNIQVVKCDECNEITIWAGYNEDFVLHSIDMEDMSSLEKFSSIHNVVFPTLYIRSKWPFTTPPELIDNNTVDLLKEAVQAREADLHLSAAVMYRASLESLLRNKLHFPKEYEVDVQVGGVQKSKKRKVDGLFDYIECLKVRPEIAGKKREELLALLESSVFDLFRWVGNVAAHGDATRSEKKLADPIWSFRNSVRDRVNRKTSESLTKLFNLVLEVLFRDLSTEASQFVNPLLKKDPNKS